MKQAALTATAMLLGAWALAAGPSFAGTYEVTACAGAAPLVNNSWAPFNNDASHLETRANCGIGEITGYSGTTSGLAAADVLGLGTQTPEGAVAGWTFTAPAGDTISAISMSRDLFDDGPGWLPQIIDAAGTPLPGESCPYNGNNGGCEISGAATHTGLDTTSLTIEVLCSPASEELTVCGGGSTLHSARAELDGATVTITDEQPPQLTSTSGPLFTGNLVRGTITGTIDSSDAGSGVQYARLYVDGALLAQQLSSCDFTQPVPCPTSSSAQFSLNTSALSNGPHEIQAAVVDAAGNQTLGASDQIVVDNVNPSAPTGVLVDGHGSGTWTNQPATITWTNPSQPAYDPIGQVNWIACPGVETSIPASGCDAPAQPERPVELAHVRPLPGPCVRRSAAGLLHRVRLAAGCDWEHQPGERRRDQLRLPDQPATATEVDHRDRPRTVHDHAHRARAPGPRNPDQLDGLQQSRCLHADREQRRPVVRVRPKSHGSVSAQPVRQVHDPGVAAGRRREHEPRSGRDADDRPQRARQG